MLRDRSFARPAAFSRLSFAVWIIEMLEVQRQRRALARLAPEHLNDIGITIEEAREEANRMIWDVPSNWQQSSSWTKRPTRARCDA